MSCRIDINKVSQELGRTSFSGSSRLRRHIASCPDCTAKVEQLSEVTRLLNGLPLESPASAGKMWQAVSARLEPRTSRQRSFSSSFSRKWGFATVFMAIIGYLLLMPHLAPSDSSDLQALMAEHNSILAVSALTADDAETLVKKADVGFDIVQPSLSSDWRLASINHFTCQRGFPVVHMVYANQNKKLSIFQKPSGGGRGGGMGMGQGWRGGRGNGGGRGRRCQMMQVDGQAMAVASGGRLRFFVVGDLQQSELQQIAENLAAKENGNAP